MNRLWGAVCAVALVGCVKAPDVVVVDRATALEQQAAGSFEAVEKQLASRAVAPHPVPLTPDQLDTAGIKPPSLVDRTRETEADRVDGLLRQHCIGEGKDGLLVDTHDDCRGAADRAAAVALIDRTNSARMQLWRWMQAERPTMSLEQVRRAWRETHARGIVCRGWVQNDAGKWEAKKC